MKTLSWMVVRGYASWVKVTVVERDELGPQKLVVAQTQPYCTHPFATMDSWSKLQSSLGGLNLGQSANKLAKGFNASVQATKERMGQVAVDEITELPHGSFLSHHCHRIKG